ncbi:MAG TPA: hypothetical protein VNI61_02460, partial [Gemmatimonadales bacterium]|nr:hypothetical protein [Gemmatimonadales bacterium]
ALAALGPELAERFAPRPVTDVADMGASLGQVLAAVAEEQPVAVAVDDAHWADGPSLAALASAMSGLGRSRVVLLVTVAEGVGHPPRELAQLQAEVGRRLPGVSVRLGPLTESELGTLVAALAPWCRADGGRDRLTRRLFVETGGNPFYAVTLLGALARAATLQEDFTTWPPARGTLDAPLPFSVPSLVRHAIAVRVGELDGGEQAVLRAASVCGQVLEPEVVAAVAQRPVAEVERALPAFEHRGLVRFDGRRYVFAAPLVVEAVRAECLSRGDRRRLEERAIAALALRDDLEARALRVELMAPVAPGAEVLELAVGVAREALEAGAVRLAQRALAAAELVIREARLDDAVIGDLRARLRGRRSA